MNTDFMTIRCRKFVLGDEVKFKNTDVKFVVIDCKYYDSSISEWVYNIQGTIPGTDIVINREKIAESNLEYYNQP